jgi:hypothetical protein
MTDSPKEHPEIEEVDWIDDAFRMEKTRMGLWKSVLKNGKDMLFGLEKESTQRMTSWHLKCLQDGTLDENSKVINDGVVGGKL